ncbi:SGNH/GDSL hydrolase family protein [Paraburkholderia nemoris]|uniref:SGNH/GDSL hydrolase family protein n=1 Tax=Paraburkholderia nemoris TaxID=2793076 RepID=UPI001B095C34|nr:SGNH/GDSL hydrolase family protein [Paraburkholderia nemoris]CAE6692593.1 hypothetical protein LMG22931_00442 [Paraburkholderia nemoris]
MSAIDNLKEAISGIVLNWPIIRKFANGGAADTVDTGAGTLPVMAKVVADAQDMFEQAKTDLIAQKGNEINQEADGVLAQTRAVAADVDADAGAAAASSVSAVASAASAAAAANAAAVSGRYFATVATGVAGSADGQSFSTLSADGKHLVVYQRQAGAAVEQLRFATQSYLDSGLDFGSYPRSGYAGAIVDSQGRIALGVRPNGKIDIGNMQDVGGKAAQNASIATGPASGDASAVATPNGSARTNPRLTAEMSALQAAPSNVMLTQGRSNYAWPWTDSQNRVAGGLDLSGNLWSKGLNVTSIIASINTAGMANLVAAAGLTSVVSLTSTYGRSGYAWAVIGSGGRVPLGLDFAGNLISKGTNLNARIAALENGTINNAVYNKALFGNKSITCFGDSLTAGAGGTTGGWPAILGTLLTRSVTKVAVGGQNAMQIGSRQGGVPILLTVANNTIPASGGVAVTAYSVTPITSQGPGTIHGTLFGVPGTLSATFNGDGSISAYAFTRDAAGSAVQIDAGTAFLIDLNDHDSDIAIYWYGRNDYPTGVSDFVSAGNNIRNALAASIAIQKPAQKRFVIIGVTNGDRTNEHKGETIYNAIVQTNRDLRALYPRNFIDVRTLLVRAYDPSQAQDVIDFGNDVPPSSLRSDPIHLNDAGYRIVAQAVANLINQNGW